jgi:threonine dehydratase
MNPIRSFKGRGADYAHQELGIVLEPAGAAGLAALLTHPKRFSGQTIGTILTGGNLTVEQMQQWLAP